MFISIGTIFRLALCIVSLWFGLSSANAAVHNLGAFDQGWYNSTGAHNTGNTNTLTGNYGTTEYRAWFKFTVPAECADGVASAQWTINSVANSAGSGSLPHNVSVNAISQANVDGLGVLTPSVALFNDIGSGSVGAMSIPSNANFNQTVVLSGAALTAIEIAAGNPSGAYAIGLNHLPDVGNYYIMGYSNPSVVSATLNINCEPKSTITLNKTVINDHGGTAITADFIPSVNATAITWGSATTFTPGSYTVSETTLPGYSAGDWGGDCAANGSINLVAGQNAVCNIINNDQGIDLDIVKTVDNQAPNIGAMVTFTLSISNLGPDVATDLLINDIVPAGFVYQAATIGGGDSRDDTDPVGVGLSWVINSLPPGSPVSLVFSTVVQAP